MKLFKALFRITSFLAQVSKGVQYTPSLVALAMVAGIISGIANTGLIALINTALNSTGSTKARLVWGFVALCIILPGARFLSHAILIKFTARAMRTLRVQLCRQILAARLRLLEELGPHRLMAALTEDVPTISHALTSIPTLCMHLAIVITCFIYMIMLSWKLFIGVIIFLAFVVFSYQIPFSRAMRYVKLSREKWDDLVKYFRAVTDGTKELKLYRERRNAFFGDLLQPTAMSVESFDVRGTTTLMAGTSWGHIMFFALIGVILFAVPSFLPIEAKVVSGYALTLLYVMVPLEVILGRLPELARANVSINKLESLGLSLISNIDEGQSSLDSAGDYKNEMLRLEGVTHSYHLEKENRNFTLGPIDLSFGPTEVVFLTGGNGSGKTTLAKLLTGLYTPETGEIRLNRQLITDENRDDYRQNFSMVFSDFFLFESLLGIDSPDLDTRARDYLVKLLLEHKVQVVEGKFSTTELSQGQRKRLALLAAYLEDRPIYIFDEWAADQDPMFKEIFYYQLLPELKERGKLVIVISHDDSYYHVADRVIKLDYGKVVTGSNAEAAAAGDPVFGFSRTTLQDDEDPLTRPQKVL